MASSHVSEHWWDRMRRKWRARYLKDEQYRFLFAPPPVDEWISLDCETTGLNRRSDEIISIGAVRIAGNRILASEKFEVLIRPQRGVKAESVRIHRLREQDLANGMAIDDAIRQLLKFIGSRPVVGYYLEFDMAMLNRAVRPILGQGLPHQRIEVSGMYYDYKFSQLKRESYERQANPHIDLSFATLMNDLGLPMRDAHDAINDAVMTAMAFIKLRTLI